MKRSSIRATLHLKENTGKLPERLNLHYFEIIQLFLCSSNHNHFLFLIILLFWIYYRTSSELLYQVSESESEEKKTGFYSSIWNYLPF